MTIKQCYILFLYKQHFYKQHQLKKLKIEDFLGKDHYCYKTHTLLMKDSDNPKLL